VILPAGRLKTPSPRFGEPDLACIAASEGPPRGDAGVAAVDGEAVEVGVVQPQRSGWRHGRSERAVAADQEPPPIMGRIWRIQTWSR